MLLLVWWQQGLDASRCLLRSGPQGWLHRMCPAVPGAAGESFSWMLLQWFLIKIPWFSWINATSSKNLQQRSFSASLKDAELEKCGWADVSAFMDEFKEDLGEGGMVCLMASRAGPGVGAGSAAAGGQELCWCAEAGQGGSWAGFSCPSGREHCNTLMPVQTNWDNKSSNHQWWCVHSPLLEKPLCLLPLSCFLFLCSPSPHHKCNFFHPRPCKQSQSTNHPSNELLRWWRRDDCEMAAGSLAACPALEGFGMRLPLRSAAALCPHPGRRQLQACCREASQDLTAVLSIWGWEWRSDFPGVTGPICTWMGMSAVAACSWWMPLKCVLISAYCYGITYMLLFSFGIFLITMSRVFHVSCVNGGKIKHLLSLCEVFLALYSWCCICNILLNIM